MSEEQRLSMFRSIAAESEQLHGLVRRADPLSREAVLLTAECLVSRGAS